MTLAQHLACGNLVWWVISGPSMPAEICDKDKGVPNSRLLRNWQSYVRSAVLSEGKRGQGHFWWQLGKHRLSDCVTTTPQAV